MSNHRLVKLGRVSREGLSSTRCPLGRIQNGEVMTISLDFANSQRGGAVKLDRGIVVTTDPAPMKLYEEMKDGNEHAF